MHQKCFIPTLSIDWQMENGVIFSAWPDFCVFQCLTRRDSLANFRAQKARENLERERVLRTELGRALEK